MTKWTLQTRWDGITIRNCMTWSNATDFRQNGVLKSANTGFGELRRVRDFMQRNTRGDGPSMAVEEAPCYEFAPIVSCRVGRSSSNNKAIFRDNRHAFLLENLNIYVSVACNQLLDSLTNETHIVLHILIFFSCLVPPFSQTIEKDNHIDETRTNTEPWLRIFVWKRDSIMSICSTGENLW